MTQQTASRLLGLEAESLSVDGTLQNYTVSEAEERFWQERLAETVLRVIAMVLMLAALPAWLIPAVLMPGATALPGPLVSIVVFGLGLLIYIHAARGFRDQISVDLSARKIVCARLNARGKVATRLEVPLGKVQSLFVQRAGSFGGVSTLYVRLEGAAAPQAMLCGASSELEALHRGLCKEIKRALDCTPKRVGKLRRHYASRTERPESDGKRSGPDIALA